MIVSIRRTYTIIKNGIAVRFFTDKQKAKSVNKNIKGKIKRAIEIHCTAPDIYIPVEYIELSGFDE
ncbi:MAG: hypothetical protein FWB92_00590 [Oscillospiraceae bacterium]|nr:hypothetical protein [Oscillospiraceae bacterium]